MNSTPAPAAPPGSAGQPRRPASWAATRERGALFAMWLMFHAVKLLSGPVTMPFVYLSTAYFFVVSGRARGRLAGLPGPGCGRGTWIAV